MDSPASPEFFMYFADGIILLIIAVSALIGLWRGFVREAFSLVTWVAAFIIAALFSPGMDQLLESTITTPSVRLAAAFGILFVATLFIGGLLNRLLVTIVKATGLSGTDRALGTLFGLLRGVILVVVMVAVLQAAFAEADWWQQSSLVPYLLAIQQSLWLFLGQFFDWLVGVAGY